MKIIIRDLGLCNWIDIANRMQYFTKKRNKHTVDELWFLEHYPVFTYGFSEKKKYFSHIQNIPVFYSNRGGKITYHGPGQLITYLLIDLRRKKIKFYELVKKVEKLIVQLLMDFNISSNIRDKYPGIYIHKQKVCSLGFRIIKGCSMHGIALNVNMDLTPFNYISPCGNENITMTQIKDFNNNVSIQKIKKKFIKHFCLYFKYPYFLSKYYTSRR